MSNTTVLNQEHVVCGAKMVDFHGWYMPLHYGSQIEEHNAVREVAGMFDVSHMTVIDARGKNVRLFLQKLLANDIAKLTYTGKALYSCMLNETGGVIDDLIVYYVADDYYRLVVNSATREKDVAWITQQAKIFHVTIVAYSDLAMIAVQGPQAIAKACSILPTDVAAKAAQLKPFHFYHDQDYFIAHTGYTGERGLEIIVPADQGSQLWQDLLAAGVRPCGLGARDTLRLEAGMNLYGQDMDETTSPLESGLAWTVALKPEERDFIGRSALINNPITQQFMGIELQGAGILRHEQVVHTDQGTGIITSGSFSPTLKKSIGFARVPIDCARQCTVEIRGKQVPAQLVKLPFVKK
jgi:aminomethyltransferase